MAGEPVGPGALAHGPRESAHRARHSESILGDAVRSRPGEDAGGFRLTGRMAYPPGSARLAGDRVRSERLGHPSCAEDHRDEPGIPAILASHAGTAAAR